LNMQMYNGSQSFHSSHPLLISFLRRLSSNSLLMQLSNADIHQRYSTENHEGPVEEGGFSLDFVHNDEFGAVKGADCEATEQPFFDLSLVDHMSQHGDDRDGNSSSHEGRDKEHGVPQ
ncbi:hypothetical protein PFISCL1PPCAC_12078, partial [Pristionchus fissidentatus]